MTNFTGANVIDATEVAKYQTDIFDFGIGSGTTEVAFFISQTTNDIFRELRIRWWPVYKTNVYTDITVLNTEEMVNTKINLDQFKRAEYIYFYINIFAQHTWLDLRQIKIDLKEWQNTIKVNLIKNLDQC